MIRWSQMTFAALFAVVACKDNSNSTLTGPNDPSQPILPSPSMTTIAGRITVTGSGLDRIIELRDGFNNVYRLVGVETKALANVDGADIVARGTFDANPGFVVDEFQVTAMAGRSALDGRLELTAAGFALRLANGTLQSLPSLPGDCAEHIGARLWIVGWEEGVEVAYGVIAPAS